jgi:hypothetical protein
MNTSHRPSTVRRFVLNGSIAAFLLAASGATAQAQSVAAKCSTSKTKIVVSSSELSVTSPSLVPIQDAEVGIKLKKDLQCVIVEFSAEGFAPFPNQSIDVSAQLSDEIFADPPLVSLVSYGPSRGTANSMTFVAAFVPAGNYTLRMMYRTVDSGGQAGLISSYTMIVHY